MIKDIYKKYIKIPDAVKDTNFRLFIVTNYIYTFAFLVHLFWIVFFAYLGLSELSLINILSCTVYIICFIMNRKAYHISTMIIASMELLVHGAIAMLYLGWDSGFHYFIVAITPFIFFANMKKRYNPLKFTLAGFLLLLYLSLCHIYTDLEPWREINNISLIIIEDINIINMFIALSFLGYYYTKATRETEESLEKSEKMYRAVVEDQTELISRYTPDWIFTFVNNAYCRYFNTTKEELIGNTFRHHIYEEDIERVRYEINKVSRENPIVTIKARIVKPDGEIRWAKWTIRALYNKNGKLIEYQVVGKDITEQEEAEMKLKQTMKELEIANQKLERSNNELEQFAFVASHDLKSPLAVVMSYISIIERDYNDVIDEEGMRLTENAKNRTQSMLAMIDTLLSYSRITTEGNPFHLCNAEDSLKKALKNIEIDIKSAKAHITYEALPRLIGDETQLVSVFQNLISNSIKFCKNKIPRIYIGASPYKKNDEKPMWLFSVKDNGIGINPKHKEKIFLIFRRVNKNKYPGTGIGLAFCKKIIERHGGRIWFESTKDIGTTFYFTIERKEL